MDGRRFEERLRDITNAHDVDGIVGFFRDDYALVSPCHPSRNFVGTDQVRRNWTGMLADVPDLGVQVVSAVRSGDTVWSEWEMRGTRRDGVPHLLRGVIIFDVVEDQARAARFFVEPVDTDPVW
ncbi:MAG: nuclear transport factor 2 family protein [Nocardioides sp.]